MENSHHSNDSFVLTSTIKTKGITTVASSVTRKRSSESMLNEYRVNRESEKIGTMYEKMQSLTRKYKSCIHSLIDWILYTLIIVARLKLQSRWCRSIAIKFKISVCMVFFATPIVCFSVVLHGPPYEIYQSHRIFEFPECLFEQS